MNKLGGSSRVQLMSDEEIKTWRSTAPARKSINDIFDITNDNKRCIISDIPDYLDQTKANAETILQAVNKIKITNNNNSIIKELERLNYMIFQIFSRAWYYGDLANTSYSSPKVCEAISLKLPAVSNKIISMHFFILPYIIDPQKTTFLVKIAHQLDKKTTLKVLPKDTIDNILMFWLQLTASKFQGCTKDVMRGVTRSNTK